MVFGRLKLAFDFSDSTDIRIICEFIDCYNNPFVAFW